MNNPFRTFRETPIISPVIPQEVVQKGFPRKLDEITPAIPLTIPGDINSKISSIIPPGTTPRFLRKNQS